MNRHDDVRGLLALAAAGELEAEEQRRVNEHVRECAACAQGIASLRELAAGLRILPAPPVSLGLAARTRARVAAELAAREERRRHHLLLGLLIVFGWVLTLVALATVHWFGDDMARLLHVTAAQFELGFFGYGLLAAIASAAFAALAGPRVQGQRRLS